MKKLILLTITILFSLNAFANMPLESTFKTRSHVFKFEYIHETIELKLQGLQLARNPIEADCYEEGAVALATLYVIDTMFNDAKSINVTILSNAKEVPEGTIIINNINLGKFFEAIGFAKPNDIDYNPWCVEAI